MKKIIQKRQNRRKLFVKKILKIKNINHIDNVIKKIENAINYIDNNVIEKKNRFNLFQKYKNLYSTICDINKIQKISCNIKHNSKNFHVNIFRSELKFEQ